MPTWLPYLGLLFSYNVMATQAPLNDNILFAFEKCKNISANLNTGTLTETASDPFDLHCKSSSDPMEYRCEFFDPGSNSRKALELLRGGIDKNGSGILQNTGGSVIRFFKIKNHAQFETSISDESEKVYGHKMCVGIFIYEKEALKKK